MALKVLKVVITVTMHGKQRVTTDWMLIIRKVMIMQGKGPPRIIW